MNVNYKTYPSNLGHIDSPGCFRCHGKLVGTTGDQTGKPIDAGCTIEPASDKKAGAVHVQLSGPSPETKCEPTPPTQRMK